MIDPKSDAPDFNGFAGFEQIQTPAVVLNGVALSENIAAMQARTAGQVALHPHIKTHKSLELARRQIAAGAAGVTASRAPEAIHFIEAGLPAVTVAHPIIDAAVAADLLTRAYRNKVELRFVIDSSSGIEALGSASHQTSLPAQAFIEIDVGLNRCGVRSDTDDALVLARQMQREGIAFLGLLSHAGQSYGAPNPEKIREIAADERAKLLALAERLTAAGFPPSVISVGSTPTSICNAGFAGLSELRPGNYIFLDMTAVRLGIAKRSDLALAVAATVVSTNDRYAIIDAGSKTLSSDMGPHGTGAGAGFGEAWLANGRGPFRIEKLSEEHGFIACASGDLKIGDKLLILPNHACPVVNLATSLHELRDGAATLISVDA